MIRKTWGWIAFGALALIFLIAEYPGTGDFGIFYKASKALANGDNMYELRYGGYWRYLYSPLFAILIYPLTGLSDSGAALIWKALSFLMLARSYLIVDKMVIRKLAVGGSKHWLYLVSAIGGLYVIYQTLHQGQMTCMMLWAILECVYQCERKKYPLLGCAILALAINIKLLPLVAIPYLLYRGYFKATGIIVGFLALFLLLPSLVVGHERNMELLASWWSLINPTTEQNVIDLKEYGFHSLTSFISATFTDVASPGPSKLYMPRHIFNLDHETVGYIIRGVQLFLIAGTLYFLRSKPFKQPSGPLHRLWEISYLCLVIPLIFPHQQTYGFYLILPAILYVTYFTFFSAERRSLWLRISLIICFLILNLEIFLGLYKDYFWHYKTLTYGVLILLVLLAVCSPFRKSLQEQQAA